MNVSYLEQHLKNGGSLPARIVDEMDIYSYKYDRRVRDAVNKALDTTYVAVYRRELCSSWFDSSSLALDSGLMFVVTSTDRVIKIDNHGHFSVTDVESHIYDFTH